MIVLPIFEKTILSPFESQGTCSCENRRMQQMREKFLDRLFDDPLELSWHRNPLMRRRRRFSEGSLQKKTSDGNEKKGDFVVHVKTSDFKPEEISVKVEGQNLMIHATHEEKLAESSVFREIRRNFTIPSDVDTETIVAKLDKDGVLSIRGKSNIPAEVMKEVQIKDEDRNEKSFSSDKVVSLETEKSQAQSTELDNGGNSEQSLESQNQQHQEISKNQETLNGEGDFQKVLTVKDEGLSVNKSSGFSTSVETSGFKPEEISVKIKNGLISVHAKHEENESGLFIHRELRREFTIPNDVDPEVLVAEMNEDGSLTVQENRNNDDLCHKQMSKTTNELSLDIRVKSKN